jgi:hypothetical protein
MVSLKLQALLPVLLGGVLLAACSCSDEEKEPCSGWRFPDDGEPGGMMWPVGSGTTPEVVGVAYGQVVYGQLHRGLDVVAETGAGVYALEDGVLEQVEEALANYRGVIVSSKAFPKRALLYLHVLPLDPETAEGREVKANELLGTVEFEPWPHVHLARLGPGYEDTTWAGMDDVSIRNPLALLDPEYIGDTVEPTIESAGDGELLEPLTFRSSTAGAAPILSTSIPSGLCEVLARVRDFDGRSPDPLFPYCLSFVIDGELRFRIRFDGLLTGMNVYSESSSLFELTGGEASDPSEFGAWGAVAGPHHLELCVHDVLGNEARAAMSVIVTE